MNNSRHGRTWHYGIRLYSLIIAALILFQPLCRPVSARDSSITSPDSFDIDFKNGMLKVSVERQGFRSVMEEVARKTGVKINTQDLTDEEVTMHFGLTPLEEGLQKMIVGWSYVLFYDTEEARQPGGLSQIIILPKAVDGSVATAERNTADVSRDVTALSPVLKKEDAADQKNMTDFLKAVNSGDKGIGKEIQEALRKMRENKVPEKKPDHASAAVSTMLQELKDSGQTGNLERSIKEIVEKTP